MDVSQAVSETIKTFMDNGMDAGKAHALTLGFLEGIINEILVAEQTQYVVAALPVIRDVYTSRMNIPTN